MCQQSVIVRRPAHSSDARGLDPRTLSNRCFGRALETERVLRRRITRIHAFSVSTYSAPYSAPPKADRGRVERIIEEPRTLEREPKITKCSALRFAERRLSSVSAQS